MMFWEGISKAIGFLTMLYFVCVCVLAKMVKFIQIFTIHVCGFTSSILSIDTELQGDVILMWLDVFLECHEVLGKTIEDRAEWWLWSKDA